MDALRLESEIHMNALMNNSEFMFPFVKANKDDVTTRGNDCIERNKQDTEKVFLMC